MSSRHFARNLRGSGEYLATLTFVWPPTEDQVILAVTAVAAITGAVFAIRADVVTRWNVRQVSARREADIQPRLRAQWSGGGLGRGTVSFTNAGGAATRFVWVGQDDASVFTAHGIIPQHSPSVIISPQHLGNGTYQTGVLTTLLIALDVQDRWWDCRTGALLKQLAMDYVAERMGQVGLAEFTPALTALALPPVIPAEPI